MQFIKKQIIRKARSAALAQALSFSFQQAPAPDRHHHFKTDAPAMAPGNRHSATNGNCQLNQHRPRHLTPATASQT